MDAMLPSVKPVPNTSCLDPVAGVSFPLIIAPPALKIRTEIRLPSRTVQRNHLSELPSDPPRSKKHKTGRKMKRFHPGGTKVKVRGEADMIVVGGGPGGIAAALAAVRHGRKVLKFIEHGGE